MNLKPIKRKTGFKLESNESLESEAAFLHSLDFELKNRYAYIRKAQSC